MLYCGATASLCGLEVLAHSAMLPTDMIVIQARIPNSVLIQTIEESDLPPNWSSPIPSRKSGRLRPFHTPVSVYLTDKTRGVNGRGLGVSEVSSPSLATRFSLGAATVA